MKDVTIELRFLQCRSLDKERVILVAEAISGEGFTLLQNAGGQMRDLVGVSYLNNDTRSNFR